MWLLHTRDIRLQEFIPGAVPPYAILSHTWTDEEVSFKDAHSAHRTSKVKGWQKITSSCSRALKDGHTWIWIDTCCIDKSSSAELSEAINSMWHYYRESEICYAYLADVPLPKTLVQSDRLYTDHDFDNGMQAAEIRSPMANSRWFTRGWTLQELLAPRKLLFCSFEWLTIGLKNELSETLQTITGIHKQYFLGTSLRRTSIAQRMSWASKRQTTRPEDIAYSLLGLFDINMPLLYGEGTKAFKRLQLELIHNSVDQSIFAWKCPHPSPNKIGTGEVLGVLAEAPSWFTCSETIIDVKSVYKISPSIVTNAGIQLRLQIGPLPRLNHSSMYSYVNEDLRIVMLACDGSSHDLSVQGNIMRGRIGICVRIGGATVERDPIPKKGKELGDFINFAHRAFPDYIHIDPNTFAWPFKPVYLCY